MTLATIGRPRAQLFVYCLSLFLFLFFVCQQTIPCRQVVVTLAMAGAPWGLASWGERRPAAQEGRARMELKSGSALEEWRGFGELSCEEGAERASGGG